MDREKAKKILKYIKINALNENKTNKALKEIKDQIDNNLEISHIFRELGLTLIIVNVLNSPNERTQKWALSILTSCLLEKEFQKEVHEIGIHHLITILKTSKCRYIQHRVCRVIGQQCNYFPSCTEFHNSKVTGLIISFLKESKSNEEKESAIKTLRSLANTQEHQLLVLQENSVYYICHYGLISSSNKLCLNTLKVLCYFCSFSNSGFFKQLMKGTDNLQTLTKLFEDDENGEKKYILNIFLTVFGYHSSCSSIQEYQYNCKILDFLCMAKLPYMIISKLQEKPDMTQLDSDQIKLILALCKFCELNEHWKKYSLNVLPTYYERTWMQVVECRGIALFVSALFSQKNNLTLLPSLLRGLLGLENLHSNKVEVLYRCVEAKLLPLIAEIFDTALRETSDSGGSGNNDKQCHHLVEDTEVNKSKPFSKEVSKELLELVEIRTIDLSSSPPSSESNESSCTEATSLIKSPPKLKSTISYKNLNKIKFRTGKRSSMEKEAARKKQNLVESKENEVNSATLLHKNTNETEKFDLRRAKKSMSKDMQIWMDVLEYIVRFLYQVFSMKEDIASICKQFLLKLYQYIYNSSIIHPSALKLLSVIAKNSSSIQYAMDILFIPKLAVDLVYGKVIKDCKQCTQIQAEVDIFLVKLRSFFNHHHQYGRCEVANRLNPSKSIDIKHSCVVSFSHVVTCPKLLHSFLLDHKGLDALMALLSPASNTDSKMILYANAALCNIFTNLNVEYCKKYKSSCLFCDQRHVERHNLLDLEKNRRKNQILILSSMNEKNSLKDETLGTCKVDLESDKNFVFYLDSKVVYVNKEVLSMKNEVLQGMLLGSFSESTKNCVYIKDVNALAMEMVIHFIYGCTCNVFLCRDVKVYVELIFLAQMYFIEELQLLAVHSLSYLLEQDDLFPFIESRFEILGKDLLQHLICSSMGHPLPLHFKVDLINKFLSSSLKNAFIENVSVGLTNLLTKASFLCNCDVYRKYM